MFNQILVPLDGSELADAVLPHVLDLAGQLSSQVYLLRVIDPIQQAQRETLTPMMQGTPPTMVDVSMDTARGMVESERDEADRYLQGVYQRLHQADINTRVEVAEGIPAQAIVQFARDRNIDLIALSTHGRGGLARIMHGSVADEVIRTAHCPVLIVRPQHHQTGEG